MMVERLQLLSVSLLLFLCTSSIAYWRGFFHIEKPWVRNSSFIATLGAFTIYFFYHLILEPLVFLGLAQQSFEENIAIASSIKLVGMLIIAISLAAYAYVWEKVGVFSLGKGHFRDILIGMASWTLAFPLVLFAGQVIGMIVQWFRPDYSLIEQVAVKYLKSLLDYPWIFTLNGIAVVFFVPVAEELLFRGFFQSFLAQYLKPFFAIAVSSLFFAGMHYSPDQGIANWELLFSLFILGFILGFLYERQKTILAPIALHSFFNLISFLFIIFH